MWAAVHIYVHFRSYMLFIYISIVFIYEYIYEPRTTYMVAHICVKSNICAHVYVPQEIGVCRKLTYLFIIVAHICAFAHIYVHDCCTYMRICTHICSLLLHIYAHMCTYMLIVVAHICAISNIYVGLE